MWRINFKVAALILLTGIVLSCLVRTVHGQADVSYRLRLVVELPRPGLRVLAQFDFPACATAVVATSTAAATLPTTATALSCPGPKLYPLVAEGKVWVLVADTERQGCRLWVVAVDNDKQVVERVRHDDFTWPARPDTKMTVDISYYLSDLKRVEQPVIRAATGEQVRVSGDEEGEAQTPTHDAQPTGPDASSDRPAGFYASATASFPQTRPVGVTVTTTVSTTLTTTASVTATASIRANGSVTASGAVSMSNPSTTASTSQPDNSLVWWVLLGGLAGAALIGLTYLRKPAIVATDGLSVTTDGQPLTTNPAAGGTSR